MSPPKKSADSKEIDFNALIQAIKDCLLNNKTVRETARAHELPKGTLHRYNKIVAEEYSNISTVGDAALLEFVRQANPKAPTKLVGLFQPRLICFVDNGT